MKRSVRRAVIEAAFDEAKKKGLANLALREVADRADVAFDKLFAECPNKTSLLKLFAAEIDCVAAEAEISFEDPAVDRLFDLSMARFDAMMAYRDGLRVVWTELKRDPAALLSLARPARQSLALTLEAAGVSAEGIRGGLRVRAYGLVLLDVFGVWLADDLGQNKTMARLDRRLRSVDFLFSKKKITARGKLKDLFDAAQEVMRKSKPDDGSQTEDDYPFASGGNGADPEASNGNPQSGA